MKTLMKALGRAVPLCALIAGPLATIATPAMAQEDPASPALEVKVQANLVRGSSQVSAAIISEPNYGDLVTPDKNSCIYNMDENGVTAIGEPECNQFRQFSLGAIRISCLSPTLVSINGTTDLLDVAGLKAIVSAGTNIPCDLDEREYALGGEMVVLSTSGTGARSITVPLDVILND